MVISSKWLGSVSIAIVDINFSGEYFMRDSILLLVLLVGGCGDEKPTSLTTTSKIYACNWSMSNSSKGCSEYDFTEVSVADAKIAIAKDSCEDSDKSNGQWTKEKCSRVSATGVCKISEEGLILNMIAYDSVGSTAVEGMCSDAGGGWTKI